MSSYEMKRFDEDGNLIEVPSFMIGHLLTVHHPGCAVAMCLHRSAGDHDAERRLEEARATVCTCGADRPVNIRPTGTDRRDNRDPQEVGLQHMRGDLHGRAAEDVRHAGPPLPEAS